MLEQLPVLLEYPFTINCLKCNGILFDLKIIDEFIRQKADYKNSAIQTKKDSHRANFYMLDPEILPSTLEVSKTPFLSQQKPFKMVFLAQIKCVVCKSRVGIKILSISSDFSNYQLLSRHLIDTKKVIVKTGKQDVTNQLTQRFNQQWECSNQFGQINLQQELYCNQFQHIRENQAKDNKKSAIKTVPKEQKQKNNHQKSYTQKNTKQNIKKKDQNVDKNSTNETKHLRKQFLAQSEENKQIIKQIISSIDFFNQILTGLQKRVAQTENVCNVIKQRVQKMAPLLRKKNQEQKN